MIYPRGNLAYPWDLVPESPAAADGATRRDEAGRRLETLHLKIIDLDLWKFEIQDLYLKGKNKNVEV